MILSNHAKIQLKERGISEKLVHKALTMPEEIVPADEGRTVFHLRFNDNKYLLRVIAEKCGSDWLIITVYKTTKIEKYWRGVINES